MKVTKYNALKETRSEFYSCGKVKRGSPVSFNISAAKIRVFCANYDLRFATRTMAEVSAPYLLNHIQNALNATIRIPRVTCQVTLNSSQHLAVFYQYAFTYHHRCVGEKIPPDITTGHIPTEFGVIPK